MTGSRQPFIDFISNRVAESGSEFLVYFRRLRSNKVGRPVIDLSLPSGRGVRFTDVSFATLCGNPTSQPPSRSQGLRAPQVQVAFPRLAGVPDKARADYGFFKSPSQLQTSTLSLPLQEGSPHRTVLHTPHLPLLRGVRTGLFFPTLISMLIPTLSKPNLARGALLLVLGVLPTAVHSLTSYANDFVDPDYIVGKQFPTNTVIAQKIIVQWADQYATLGPWSTCLALLTSQGFRSVLKFEPLRCHEQDYCPTDGRQTHLHELVAVLVAGLFRRRKHHCAPRGTKYAPIADSSHSTASDVAHSLCPM